MNTKTIIIAIVIIALIGFGFFFFTHKTEAPTQETTNSAGTSLAGETPADFNDTPDDDLTGPSESDVAIVTYTDDGFSPEETTIKLGQTVRFVNESSSGLWVGAALHPTHTQYPEKSDSDCLGSSFDTCKAISNGESWEFTFNSAGTWGYHNHVRASKRGTIVVSE